MLQDLFSLSFYYPFKKLLKYDDTAAYTTTAYFHYQANRFVRDFSGYRNNGVLAQRFSSPGQNAVDSTNASTYQSPYCT